jgi:hypothetical protein
MSKFVINFQSNTGCFTRHFVLVPSVAVFLKPRYLVGLKSYGTHLEEIFAAPDQQALGGLWQ